MSEFAEKQEFDFSRFSNTYEHTLDAKNRLFIPAKVRETVGTSFYLFHPLREKCLYIYSPERWEEVARQINAELERQSEMIEMYSDVQF